MYPGTIFKWHDLSATAQTSLASPVIDDAPLFMQVFSADKGTEDLIEVSGPDFASMYGTMNFANHGQSAIQAQAIIDAGGRLYAKRVVAENATIANTILCATVIPNDGGVKVKWSAQSITNCKTFEDVEKAAKELYEAGVYPLMVFTDNGRGVSKKAVRVTADYVTSRDIRQTFYTLSVYEGTSISERTTITFNPDVIYSSVAYGLDKYSTKQITGTVLSDMYELYVNEIADALTISIDEIKSYDVIFGYTYRGLPIEGFTLDAESVDMDADTGIALINGSNGDFGDSPAGTEAWATAIANVFNGTFSDEVYDIDQHKIAAILDANYPMTVKKAIYDLVNFRQDCVFFRDYGVGLTTFLDIKAKHDEFGEDSRSYFVADYATSYIVKDPLTFKNIEVTMTYDLAPVLVSHIANNTNAPVAGTINGFVLRNAIAGTLNFTPINTPVGNQKELMDNIRVNYALFEDNNCVVQSCYTSQDVFTQLSFVNNVLAIQRVLRAIRTACPKQRFALSSGSDLSNYAAAVNNVLADFSTDFSVLNFIYTEDQLKASQKILYASIEFAFLNWAQTEVFDIYAINN